MDNKPNPFDLTQDEVYELFREGETTTVIDFDDTKLISQIPKDYGYDFDRTQSLINFHTPELFTSKLRDAGFSDFNPPVDEVLRKRLIESDDMEALNTKIVTDLANIHINGDDPTTNITNQTITMIREFSRKYGLTQEQEKMLIQKALEKHLLDDILREADKARGGEPAGPPADTGAGTPAPEEPPAPAEPPADTGAGTVTPPRQPRRPEPDKSEIEQATTKLLEQERIERILAEAAENLVTNRGNPQNEAIINQIRQDGSDRKKLSTYYRARTLSKNRKQIIAYLERYGIDVGTKIKKYELETYIYPFVERVLGLIMGGGR